MKLPQLQQRQAVLGFVPSEAVRWLSPTQLLGTVGKVVLSAIFAGYSDRRETQAALGQDLLVVADMASEGHDGEADATWVDVICDTGDGFDATYTVVWAASQSELIIEPSVGANAEVDAESLRLPRAQLLVLGGDEVYPTPSSTAYEDRLVGPLTAARPASDDPTVPEGHALRTTEPVASGSVTEACVFEDAGGASLLTDPSLLVLPGNHDWYDSLTAFLRMFGQQRSIGAWQTRQARSYFAVQLPQRWWLVGIDTQLGTYIDQPQIQYFRQHLSARLQPGDGVVVCVPEPTWVYSTRDPDAFNALRWFERRVINEYRAPDGTVRPTGAQARLWLTGDLHHYARFEESDTGRQFVTCGLGGAYLSETHDLPEQIAVPAPDSRLDAGPTRTLDLRHRYPAAATTRRLARRIAGVGPFSALRRNPGLWQWLGLLQVTLTTLAVLVVGVQSRLGPADVLTQASLSAVGRLALTLTLLAVVLVLVLVGTPVAQTVRRKNAGEVMVALGVQVVVSLLLLVGLLVVPWPSSWPATLVIAVSVPLVWVIGGVLATGVFACYLMLSRNHMVRGWQMSGQAIEDYKGFLRIRFAGPTLELYPVVIDTVCRDWSLEGSRPVPETPINVRLAEASITVHRSVV